jgi:hypothetical protein
MSPAIFFSILFGTFRVQNPSYCHNGHKLRYHAAVFTKIYGGAEMKTKQRFFSLALALILILALAACGSSGQKTSSVQAASAPSPAPETGSATYSESEGDTYDAATASGTDISGDSSLSESVTALPSAEKVIYSGSAELETLDFDKTLEDLQKMIEVSGGFVQSSSVSGNNYSSIYNGKGSYRNASYTLRIPVDKFKSVQDSLKALGNVVSISSEGQNITMQYTDTASRLEACRTKETRLLELMSKASSMTDILAIETSLSDVRYQIESMTSQMKNWDSLISYSTLTLSIQEVALYSNENASTIGYGQQLKQAFSHSLNSLGVFFKGLFKFLVGAFPVLVVLAIIAVPFYFIVRASRKKKIAENETPPDETDNPPQL